MWMLLVLNAVLGAMGSDSTPPGLAQTLQVLHCPPCERIHCTPRRALKLQCKGGITTGVCGCCPVCARVAGESCGGSWDYLGKCDEGMVCVYQDTPDTEHSGICKAVLESLDIENCRPECTREYCQANPLAFCSARLVSLEKHVCHGSCVHTSCSGCMVLKKPSCPQSCNASEPLCLHRFGRCVHNHLSAPHNPAVCHHHPQNNVEGLFMCFVPSCLNPLN